MKIETASGIKLVPDGHNLTKGHIYVVDLTNEKGSNCFIQRCAVHVNGSAHGNYKAAHPLVDSIFRFQAAQSYRHRC